MNTTSKNIYVAPVSQIVIPDGIQGLIKSVARACIRHNDHLSGIVSQLSVAEPLDSFGDDVVDLDHVVMAVWSVMAEIGGEMHSFEKLSWKQCGRFEYSDPSALLGAASITKYIKQLIAASPLRGARPAYVPSAADNDSLVFSRVASAKGHLVVLEYPLFIPNLELYRQLEMRNTTSLLRLSLHGLGDDLFKSGDVTTWTRVMRKPQWLGNAGIDEKPISYVSAPYLWIYLGRLMGYDNIYNVFAALTDSCARELNSSLSADITFKDVANTLARHVYEAYRAPEISRFERGEFKRLADPERWRKIVQRFEESLQNAVITNSYAEPYWFNTIGNDVYSGWSAALDDELHTAFSPRERLNGRLPCSLTLSQTTLPSRIAGSLALMKIAGLISLGYVYGQEEFLEEFAITFGPNGIGH